MLATQPAVGATPDEPGTPAGVRSAVAAVVELTAGNGISGVIGSGVVIGRGGFVLTVDHVVGPDFPVEVRSGGERLAAQTIARDPVTDLHLLRVPGLAGHGVDVPADEPHVGQDVWAVGAAMLAKLPRRGRVIAVARPVDRLLPGVPFTATEIALAPNDSGGALLDETGSLVGMLAAVRRDPESLESVAIPAKVISRFLERVRTRDMPPRGSVGVDLTPPAAAGTGVVVASFMESGLSSESRLRLGDRIIALAGEPVVDVARLRARIGAMEVGQNALMRVERSGVIIEIEARILPLHQPFMD